MMLEPALVTYLRQKIPRVEGRVYPSRLPDPPVLPALVYQRIATRRPVNYDGPSAFVRARIQIDVWGASRGEVRDIADTLRQALLGYRGVLSGVEVSIPEQLSDLDMDDPDTGAYRVMTEYYVWHSEEAT